MGIPPFLFFRLKIGSPDSEILTWEAKMLLRKNTSHNEFPPKKDLIFLQLIVVLFIVFIANGKKAKKEVQRPADSTEDYNANVFCKKFSRLIRMEKTDEIVVVDSSVNSSVLLQCKYCEEKDNGQPKTWSRQKRIFTGNITEVETDMNNVSTSSVFISKSHSLVFRSLQETDIGLYFCKAPYVDTPDKSFNYLIDLACKVTDEVSGTLADFKNFTRFYLTHVNNELANKTYKMYNLNVKMKVFTDWSDWSDCESCFGKEYLRYRRGRCRVKPICQEAKECAEYRSGLKGFEFSDKQNTESPIRYESEEIADVRVVEQNIMGFGIALSCRSCILYQMTPTLYNTTSDIPDFILSEKCSASCRGGSLKKGPRYRKSIILAKGAHLTLICPDATIGSQVRWEHNKIRIHSNEGRDYISGTNEPRQYVDSFNTLYLFEVTDKESGNYTCFVNGVRMQEVKIIVLTRSLFFTKEFTKHLKYLGYVFLICFVAYLAGVMIICIKSHSGRKALKKNKKTAEGEERLLGTECSDSDS